MSPFGFVGFNIMFEIIPFIVLIGFIFVFGTIIYRAVQVAKDKRKPIIPVRATVLAKRMQVHGGHTSHNNTHTHSRTYYYATFELENGERIELTIPSHQIGYFVEGDKGILSFQGNLFVKFDRI